MDKKCDLNRILFCAKRKLDMAGNGPVPVTIKLADFVPKLTNVVGILAHQKIGTGTIVLAQASFRIVVKEM